MLDALFALGLLGLLTSTIFAGMALWAVAGYLRENALRHQEQDRPGSPPPLSLLKPLHGDEPGLEANLASFFEQDYPSYEILFCARASHDAGLETARQVAQRYPHIPAKFLATGGQPPYSNAKVASLVVLEAAADHEILVVSDSDVRVGPDYLRAVALPFSDPNTGAVTCPYRGVAAEGGLWARLEAVGMSVEMTAGVLVARGLEGMQFTLGPTMAFRRQTIRQIGGFGIAADYCADDFLLGQAVFQLGQKVVLSHHAIDHMVLHSRFIESMRHQIRWMQSTRFSRPKGHFGTALTFSMPFGLLSLVAAALLGHAGIGLALFAWAIATRLALGISVGHFAVRDPSLLGLLVLYPIRDAMGFCFWAASYLSDKILWRGRVFQMLPGGKMRPIA